jgi:hypothetical protein
MILEIRRSVIKGDIELVIGNTVYVAEWIDHLLFIVICNRRWEDTYKWPTTLKVNV